MIFVAFPPEVSTTPADVKVLYQKLEDLIQKHVTTIAAPQTSSDDTVASSISFLLLVIQTLTEVQRNFIDPTILVRILQRLQRDMGSSAGSHIRQVRKSNNAPLPLKKHFFYQQMPQYGSICCPTYLYVKLMFPFLCSMTLCCLVNISFIMFLFLSPKKKKVICFIMQACKSIQVGFDIS